MLGISGLGALIHDLKSKGISFENGPNGNCSLEAIAQALTELFGEETTMLVMERIQAKLQEIEGGKEGDSKDSQTIFLKPSDTKRINPDFRLIPSVVLKRKLDAIFNQVYPTEKQAIFKDMEKAGIRLDDESAYYSFKQISDYFHLAFGENTADILTNLLRKIL